LGDSEDARRYKRFIVMREMGWNYWEYRNTPSSVVDETYAWIKTDGQMQQEARELSQVKKKRG
jgi:hypothetical protein